MGFKEGPFQGSQREVLDVFQRGDAHPPVHGARPPSGGTPGPHKTSSVDPAATQGPLLTGFGAGMPLPTVAPADHDDVELNVLGCRLDIFKDKL